MYTMDSKKKRTTSLSLSSRTSKPNLQSKRSSYVQISNCNFCQQKVSKHDLKYFFSMTNKALYSKYSSSQNYYYTKDINDILANAKVPSVIIFRDIEVFEECEEYLKRFYRGIEYDGKIKMLTEYYKYHQDIPRLFMYPIINTLNRYHDKKRRLDYLRITKMLRDQNNQNEDNNKKVMKGRDVRRSIKSDYIPITDRVLAELELTQSNVMKTKEDLIKVEGNWQADSLQKSAEKITHSGSLKAYRDKLGMAINKKLMKEADKTMDQMREASVSNTLHDLNMKLGEIINKSYSVNFENSEYQTKDNTISNLGNFLNYMHDNQQSAKLNKIPEIVGISGVKIPQPLQSMPVMQHEYYRSDAPEPESRVYTSKNKLDFESLIDERTRDISTGTGLNLAEKLLKEKQPYEMGAGIIKSATKKVEPPQRKSVQKETERPFTALAASKLNGTGTSNPALKGKSVPMTILKIQNFEEVMKARQQGSPIKVNSQRSTSTEKYQKRPPSAISHRAYNAATKESSVKKPSKNRQEEMMAQRRGSQVRQADLTETSNSSRMILKSRSSINNIKDPRTTEFSTLVTHQYNDPPNSHREMKVYMDSNPQSRQNTTSGRIVSTARTSQTSQMKVSVPTTIHNNMMGPSHVSHVSHERTKSMRTTQALGVKDLRNMVGLCQINLHDASRDSKVNRSSASKTGMIRPVPSTSRLEYSGGGTSSNMSPVIPEHDMLSFKRQFEKLNKNSLQTSRDNITRHKSTKSDVRMFESGTLDLSKKVSPMQAPVSSRDRNQSPFELAKYERDQNLTARPQIYNYNTNNIVNIFVNPASQENKNKSIIKVEPKRTGSLTDRDRYASNSSSTGGVKIVSSKPMGSDVFMKYNNQQAKRQEFIDNLIKRDSTRESPVMILKKDDGSGLGLQPQIKLTRSKSGNLGSFVNNPYNNNQNNVVKSSALHSKIQKKIELDLMEEMRSTPDSYEFLVNFRSKR